MACYRAKTYELVPTQLHLHVASDMDYIRSVFCLKIHTDALEYEDLGQEKKMLQPSSTRNKQTKIA